MTLSDLEALEQVLFNYNTETIMLHCEEVARLITKTVLAGRHLFCDIRLSRQVQKKEVYNNVDFL